VDQTYLIFAHRGARYGLDVRAVREIVWLPEISPVEEQPPYIAGVFNLRGQVVAVMDLGLRFGHAHLPWLPGDQVIVIDSDGTRSGIVANELHEVLPIAQAAIENVPKHQSAGAEAQFVSGEAKLDDGLVMLLDVDALLHSVPVQTQDLPQPDPAAELPTPWFGHASPEEMQLYRSRARSLAQAQEAAQRPGLEAYAVIRLERELFALDLDLVREFSHLHGITPLPCCPPHILGNMNLRGDILTLVDVRPALDMPSDSAMSEVVVVRLGDIAFGLPAAEIVDVVQLAPADIAAIPVASDRAGRAYCKGVAAIGGQAVGILDLEKILASGELRVTEDAR
jgi:purine-binding chemotaxis protein CheW